MSTNVLNGHGTVVKVFCFLDKKQGTTNPKIVPEKSKTMNYHINTAATAPEGHPITESPKIDARDDDNDGCFTAPRTGKHNHSNFGTLYFRLPDSLCHAHIFIMATPHR